MNQTTDTLPAMPEPGFVLMGGIVNETFVRQVNVWRARDGDGYYLVMTQASRHTARCPGSGLFYAVDQPISQAMVESEIAAYGPFERWSYVPVDAEAAFEEIADCQRATGWRPPTAYRLAHDAALALADIQPSGTIH